jgi:hypothetical protein
VLKIHLPRGVGAVAKTIEEWKRLGSLLFPLGLLLGISS